MRETHRIAKDGVLEDGASFYSPTPDDMSLFAANQRTLQHFDAPVLLSRNNPRQRLYVAAFDGTGNDGDKDPLHATNISRIRDEVDALGDDRLKAGYVPGPGTQSNRWAALRDGISGHTYDERIEQMYSSFINQAWNWKLEDPTAEISVAEIGFSRGAEQAAGFARLVHERGIQDVSGAIYTKNSSGEITGVKYTKPPLVPPGQVVQVAGLIDPVGTGEPANDKDRRLPPSVISGLQLNVLDEPRKDFSATNIIDQGMTKNGRFLGLSVPGAHSDGGGGYHRNGLSNRTGNLLIDYLNALSDQPFIKKLPEPNDPRLNVIHRSEGHLWVYRVRGKVDRQSPEGTIDRLVPESRMKSVPDPFNAEPRDEALNHQFERQRVRIGPVPADPSPAMQKRADRADPQSLDAQFDRLSLGARLYDDRMMSAAVDDYFRSPNGAQFKANVALHAQQAEEKQHQLIAAQLLDQQQTITRNAHVIHM